MSETPTLPISDERTSRVLENTQQLYETGQVAEHFERWKKGISEPPTYEAPGHTLNLNEDEVADPRFWDKNEYHVPGQEAEPISEAQRPMTHEQAVEASLFPLTDRQLLAYAVANTKAVWALKHLI